MSAEAVWVFPLTSKTTSTWSATSFTDRTFAPACDAIPRLRNTRAISFDRSSSSSGASRGSASITVTSAPIER
jgi:hypothetical protein